MKTEDFEFELAHVGINTENEEEAIKTSNELNRLFGFAKDNRGASIFASSQFEVMKKNYLGYNGHIAIFANDVEKAKKHLEAEGVLFNEDTAGYGPDGKLTVIYFKDEIAGFAFHLLQRK